MPLGDFSGRHDAPKEDDIDGAQDPPIAADRNRDRADVGIWRSYGASGGLPRAAFPRITAIRRLKARRCVRVF